MSNDYFPPSTGFSFGDRFSFRAIGETLNTKTSASPVTGSRLPTVRT
jgi:hypothetical protein